jgi:hypothetical protein
MRRRRAGEVDFGRKSRSRRSRKRSCRRTRRLRSRRRGPATTPSSSRPWGAGDRARSVVFTRGFYFRPRSRNPEAGTPAIEAEREVITTAKKWSVNGASHPQRVAECGKCDMCGTRRQQLIPAKIDLPNGLPSFSRNPVWLPASNGPEDRKARSCGHSPGPLTPAGRPVAEFIVPSVDNPPRPVGSGRVKSHGSKESVQPRWRPKTSNDKGVDPAETQARASSGRGAKYS